MIPLEPSCPRDALLFVGAMTGYDSNVIGILKPVTLHGPLLQPAAPGKHPRQGFHASWAAYRWRTGSDVFVDDRAPATVVGTGVK